MPLRQDDPSLDYDGSWADASKDWPKLKFDNEAQAQAAYFRVIAVGKKDRSKGVPYGCYVLVGCELRLENETHVETAIRALVSDGWGIHIHPDIWCKPTLIDRAAALARALPVDEEADRRTASALSKLYGKPTKLVPALKSEEVEALVDRVIAAVCECHDGSELWAHAKRDPDAFRRVVHAALERIWKRSPL